MILNLLVTIKNSGRSKIENRKKSFKGSSYVINMKVTNYFHEPFIYMSRTFPANPLDEPFCELSPRTLTHELSSRTLSANYLHEPYQRTIFTNLINNLSQRTLPTNHISEPSQNMIFLLKFKTKFIFNCSKVKQIIKHYQFNIRFLKNKNN